MQEIRIKQLDSFTRVPFTGNPAAVVIDANGLTVEQMQVIAREMNLSETAFVCSPTQPFADLRIRWFTPTMEVDLCGHATIATFQALAEEGKFGLQKTGEHHFKLETASGLLPVTVKKALDQKFVQTTFGLPVREFDTVHMNRNRLCRLIGISEKDMDPKLPVMRSSQQFIIPLRKKETLFNLRPDFFTMLAMRMIMVPITLDTLEKESVIHIRFFGPSVGVKEDPVTGSMQGILGRYLYDNGVLDKSKNPIIYTAEQGDSIGRPGRVQVVVTHKKGKVTDLAIIGQAITILEGSFFLRD